MAKNDIAPVNVELTAKELVKANQVKFRANIQDIINNNMKRMQEILDTLDPKEFCEANAKKYEDEALARLKEKCE